MAIKAHFPFAANAAIVTSRPFPLELELLMRGDEKPAPAVRRAEAQDNLPATPNDLGGDVHEGLPEAFPLPAHDLAGEGELRDPLAEIPGEPGDLEPGAVAV